MVTQRNSNREETKIAEMVNPFSITAPADSSDSEPMFNFYLYDVSPDGHTISATQGASSEDALAQARHHVITVTYEALRHRPDLARSLEQFQRDIGIHLYNAHRIQEPANSALATSHSRESIVGGIYCGNDGAPSAAEGSVHLAVITSPTALAKTIVHEVIMHGLDCLTERNGKLDFQPGNGYLFGWSKTDQAKFDEFRTAEKSRLRAGKSVLDVSDDVLYGEENIFNVEFLARLGESFFFDGKRLEAASPELYNMMREYFRHDPAQEDPLSVVA